MRFSILIMGLCLLALGCEASDDPALAEKRSQLVLSTEPTDATNVLAARQRLQAEAATSVPVTLVGRIGADEATTWDRGKAAFVMLDLSIEPTTHAKDDAHDPNQCPFCQRAKKRETEASAFVQFVDAEGQVLPLDARKLFQIASNQVVVVRGVATLDALGSLLVTADAIYPRTP